MKYVTPVDCDTPAFKPPSLFFQNVVLSEAS